MTVRGVAGAANVTPEQMRAQFEKVWNNNCIDIVLMRRSDEDAGDYFREDEDPGETEDVIQANVQGQTSNAWSQARQGVLTTEARTHVYVRWFEDIRENDVIKIKRVNLELGNAGLAKDQQYRVENHNKSIHGGVVIFQEFDLKKFDQSEG